MVNFYAFCVSDRDNLAAVGRRDQGADPGPSNVALMSTDAFFGIEPKRTASAPSLRIDQKPSPSVSTTLATSPRTCISDSRDMVWVEVAFTFAGAFVG